MRLPTPEELGEKVERGEMTEAEAAEIMAERARRAALPFLYPPEEAEAPSGCDGERRVSGGRGRLKAVAGWIAAAAVLGALLWCVS